MLLALIVFIISFLTKGELIIKLDVAAIQDLPDYEYYLKILYGAI